MTASVLARKATKAAVLPLGALERRRPQDLVLLLYHRLGSGPSEIELEPARFEEHLAYLGSMGGIARPDDALAERSPGGVVLTFDDGSRDFHERALPLLVRHRAPAVLYLATGWVEGEGLAPAGHRAIAWSQLAEAVSTGLVSVGSHTHGHVNLARAAEDESEDEMRRSKELIEDRLGVACRHFAYPWGVGSRAADRAVRRWFASAALEAWKTNRAGRIDPYRLGRTPILRSDGSFFFRAKVRGRLDGEALVYRALRRGPWGAPG